MSENRFSNGFTAYHGTSNESARDILWRGVDMDKSAGGYFGTGFYLALEPELARSNYADFAGDGEPGVVLSCEIMPGARILDLCVERDWLAWRDSNLDQSLHRHDFHLLAVRAGIDGLHDNSFGGLVVYNKDVLVGIGEHESDRPAAPTPRA